MVALRGTLVPVDERHISIYSEIVGGRSESPREERSEPPPDERSEPPSSKPLGDGPRESGSIKFTHPSGFDLSYTFMRTGIPDKIPPDNTHVSKQPVVSIQAGSTHIQVNIDGLKASEPQNHSASEPSTPHKAKTSVTKIGPHDLGDKLERLLKP